MKKDNICLLNILFTLLTAISIMQVSDLLAEESRQGLLPQNSINSLYKNDKVIPDG